MYVISCLYYVNYNKPLQSFTQATELKYIDFKLIHFITVKIILKMWKTREIYIMNPPIKINEFELKY